ncbi:MAG: hypothetical protein AB1649_21395 [Chloroflexota bacterium]
MNTINIKEPGLISEINAIARDEGQEAVEFVTEAVRHHLARYRQKRILSETTAWYQMPPNVRDQYQGQFVAVYRDEIVDSDEERLTLYQRIRERFGRRPVLIIEGGDQPMPVYHVRSPQRA